MEHETVLARLRRPIEELKSRPGRPASAEDLAGLGFQPLKLDVSDTDVDLTFARGCEWTTLGEVPKEPGVYLFTVERSTELRVMYAGQTEHLWMVTKGIRPGRGSRGPQRYGRPRNLTPGETRWRVNVLIADRLRDGWTALHWVRKEPRERLTSAEDKLIDGWGLRHVGWNIR